MDGDTNPDAAANDGDPQASSAAIGVTPKLTAAQAVSIGALSAAALLPGQRQPVSVSGRVNDGYRDAQAVIAAHSPELDPAPMTATVREVVDFIGRGLAWPMRVDASGSISLTTGVVDLDSSVRLILLTAPGERLMRPDFGCRIHELVFEPINANTIGLMKHSVQQALAQWEPRITVEDVGVEVDPETSGLVQIHVGYRVRATNDRRNLVHPFYLIPHDGEPIAKGTA